MQTAWVIYREHSHSGRVAAATFIGLLDGHLQPEAVQSLLPHLYAVEAGQLRETSQHFIDQSFVVPGLASLVRLKTAKESTLERLSDGSQNWHRLVCAGSDSEQLVAVFAENVALEMGEDYKEYVRWSEQDYIDATRLGPYHECELATSGGAVHRKRI